ncbi:hypothetical protein JTE90_020737 [Oedothorax gibbosus]|uniref:Endonuclease/exonuclease/phosphatase domain-containing protein n=1 Tax=Oedothorax gibbosus TaxID=931172 RepID=A0AAV6TJQ4_9ARAC|nr:hypothetical protein JTE90_020737 [Oedothorax gibbosus]
MGSLQLVHWNCRSLKNKLFLYKNSIFSSSHILAFQETFLKPCDKIHLQGKTIYRLDLPNRPPNRGAGLPISINTNISSQIIQIPNLPAPEAEIIVVKIQINTLSLTIVNIFSPRGLFWTHGSSVLRTTLHILVGDFNIKHPALGSPLNSSDGDKVIDWITTFTSAIRKFLPNLALPPHLFWILASFPLTFSGTCLDVFPDLLGSDHKPIGHPPITSCGAAQAPYLVIYTDGGELEAATLLGQNKVICHIDTSTIFNVFECLLANTYQYPQGLKFAQDANKSITRCCVTQSNGIYRPQLLLKQRQILKP